MTLAIRNVSLRLKDRLVLNDISAAWQGGLVGLIGPNGAGKSSLMRVIAGLWKPAAGEVLLEGMPLTGLNGQARARRLSFLPPERDMTWPLPVRDVVALGRHPHRGSFAPWTDEDQKAVEQALSAVGARDLADRPISDISNGERARVLLARALAVNAPILLVDEAVAALDPAHQLQVMEVLRAEAGKGRLVLAVLHDLGLARRYCDELVMLHQGRIHGQGAPDEVLTDQNLADVYGITALMGTQEGGPYVVPLSRIKDEA
jgi:iron complex transport system ATP-binding protein